MICEFRLNPNALDGKWARTNQLREVLVLFDEFDDDLAEMSTVQQYQESRGGIFETVHNVLAIANGAIADTLCDRSERTAKLVQSRIQSTRR